MTVVDMVQVACREAIDNLELDMTATLGRTNKLVSTLTHSKSLSRRPEGPAGDSLFPYDSPQVCAGMYPCTGASACAR